MWRREGQAQLRQEALSGPGSKLGCEPGFGLTRLGTLAATAAACCHGVFRPSYVACRSFRPRSGCPPATVSLVALASWRLEPCGAMARYTPHKVQATISTAAPGRPLIGREMKDRSRRGSIMSARLMYISSIRPQNEPGDQLRRLEPKIGQKAAQHAEEDQAT